MDISHRTGMGAVPYADHGVTFRVWAPFASQVTVTGTFNHWSGSADKLGDEGNGYWSADISSAKIGDEYRFIITNKETSVSQAKNDPYAREVTNSCGNSVIVTRQFDWGDEHHYQPPNWNEMVIYEMHMGTFNDEPGGLPGNLTTAIERLDYLKDLGINTIKVMPLSEFAGDFSWGYNPAHIFAVESIYGGPKAFKEFVKKAHSLGIAVIMDIVYNHLGPSDLDLWKFDGWGEKGGIYFYNDGRSKTPWGDTRPDYGRPEVRQYLRDNCMMWLDEFHIDGVRWDSTVNIRTRNNGYGGDIEDGWHLMQMINNEINQKSPWKISIAEDLQNNEWLTKETHKGGAGFDAQWASDFVHPVREAIITQDDPHRNMYAISEAISTRYNGNSFERVIYTESHDEVANGKSRVPEEIWEGSADSWYSRKRSTLGAILTFTSPGIPMIFQGQEILEDKWFRDTDPIDWTKLKTFEGIHRMYRDLIRLRRNWFNETAGLRGKHINVYHINNNDKVIAYHRWENGGAGDDVVVIINLSNQTFDHYQVGFPRGGKWKVRFNSDWNGYGDDFSNQAGYDTVAHHAHKDGLQYCANVGLGPYSAIILSQPSSY